MRRFFPTLASMIMLLTFTQCQKMIEDIGIFLLTPIRDFDKVTPPPAPDYDDPDAWAALPHLPNFSDVRPMGDSDQRMLREVDVFFIHPTGYIQGKTWNEELLEDSPTARKTKLLMANNASVYNDARVFAPRYRQAILVANVDQDGENGGSALGLAYEDVRRAFEYYLEVYNQGRPFILAGHSQGSFHGKRLVDELIDGTALADRMVAAYLIGSKDITETWVRDLSSLTLCDAPDKTKCVVGFNAFAEEATPDEGWGTEGVVCINPLTWTADENMAGQELHLGMVPGLTENDVEDWSQVPGGLLAPRDGTYAVAQKGALLLKTLADWDAMGQGVYHAIEYSIFYENLRANVRERSQAFLDDE